MLLLDPAEFTVRTRLAPPPHGGEGNAESKTDPVTALAWSRNGQWLAVATGSPSQRGEVHLYAVPAPLPVAAAIKPAKSVAAHADLIASRLNPLFHSQESLA